MTSHLPGDATKLGRLPSGMVDRRAALRLFASGVALSLASCGKPDEQIVPYVQMPEGETPGVPVHFASALPLAGYGRGVVVTSIDGRPIKIEGNPLHPYSLGATDVFAEATVLSLYDPDRSKTAFCDGRIQAWTAFEGALLPQIERQRSRQGAGLAILTGRVTSPTLIGQIGALTKSLPRARWYRYDPIEDDAIRAGAVQAFGKALTELPRFRDTRVLLTLDADPLGSGPAQVRFSRDIIDARRSKLPQDSLRLYAVEPGWTLTGALADHRLALRPELIRNVALAIARELGAATPAAPLPDEAAAFVRAVVADLRARPETGLILAGPGQPPEVHALCHWINGELHAPCDFIQPVDPHPSSHSESLKSFAADADAGRIEALFILGANPVYETPGELGVADAIARIPFSCHLGCYRDETAARCTWHLPQSHIMESWSDIRAVDGTASIIQPLIRPLYDTRTSHQLVATIIQSSAQSFDLVRDQWRPSTTNDDFDMWWLRAVQDGVIENTTAAKIGRPPAQLPQMAPAGAGESFVVTLAPSPTLSDGSFANNAWLQECPVPFTKQVWGNALHLAEADARNLHVVDGDIVRLIVEKQTLEAPVIVRSGQAERTIHAFLGYGRTAAGSMGSEVGFDLYRLRPAASPWVISDVSIARTGRTQNLLRTQHFFTLEGDAEELQPRFSLADLAKGDLGLHKPGEEPPTLYRPQPYDTYKWAMVVDTSACIGCNACVIACQAENNVPIVGPDEIAEGRDMHWLRIDDYVVGGRPGFSPVPCMHCEHAPCEPVCPVAASVHDSEGLNVQVYNRCVGTRFCQSNCPYKVRRFNFFGYADGEEYGNYGADIVKAVFNPDVTVRGRGVMEKCTYCVQRISRARRAAEKEHRAIRDGEIVTACQASCPTHAISFGDLSDPGSSVQARRREPHAYALLGELGTRPRTTYLARLQNPNPDYGKAQS